MMTFPHTLHFDAKPLESLAPYARNTRRHSEAQIVKFIGSIREFGWTVPILTDETDEIIAGHGRLTAAQRIHKQGWQIPGWTDTSTAPVLVKAGLTESQKRAYRILDNRLAEDSGWDSELLALELADLSEDDFDLDLTGFEEDEIGELLKLAVEDEAQEESEKPEPDEATQAMLETVWKRIASDWTAHIESVRRGEALLSPKVTPGIAAWNFVRAKYCDYEYPGVASLAFCPERFWTAGSRKKSVADTIRAAPTNPADMRGLQFAAGECPSFDRILSFGMPMSGGRMPLDFPARLASELIDEFTPVGGRVLDPCHGWGGRYIGFLLSDKARAYFGCDPSPYAHAGLIRARETLAPFAEGNKTAEFIASPFEDVELPSGFDFALTSPPYFDVETYAGGNTSSERYRSFDVWVQGFYLPMLRKVAAHLKPGGTFALQVGSQTYPLAKTAIDNAADCGFDYLEKRNAGMNNSLQQTPEETAEAILILRKPGLPAEALDEGCTPSGFE
jgi:ParB-like chromosome segregation protein Spo0J